MAIVGATGYTGAELLRLLQGHPLVQASVLFAHSRAGEPVASVLPTQAGLRVDRVESFDPGALSPDVRAVFCALPHGASAGHVAELRATGRVVFDLSADFRLEDATTYAEWYGEHPHPELLADAVYGLVEVRREALREADLIAVPGCYPTASLLALLAPLRDGLIGADGIVIDAKSGVSGAGRKATESTHLPQAAEGIRAYKSAGLHRHIPEIEQELSRAASREVRITFTPHLTPMSRGILATCYASRVRPDVDAAVLTGSARRLFSGSPSVVVLDPGAHPDTLWVRGSNRAYLAYDVCRRTGRVIAQCVIDNLVKGAAGQAIQCMNVRFGWEEGSGLTMPAVWP